MNKKLYIAPDEKNKYYRIPWQIHAYEEDADKRLSMVQSRIDELEKIIKSFPKPTPAIK